MLFLTYHVIAADAAGDFYTVPSSVLTAQLDLVAERKFVAGSMDAVLRGEFWESSYFATFDDGTSDHLGLVAPILEERGLRGVFFVPTEKIGHPGRLTREQVSELAERGHEIGCHSHEHRRLDTQSDAGIREQLAISCRILTEITGRAPRILAPPGGYTSARVRAIAAEAGIRAMRTMKWGLNRHPVLDDLATIPLNRSISLGRLGKILDGHGLAWLRTVFFAKQVLKSLFPLRLYERLRGAAFQQAR